MTRQFLKIGLLAFMAIDILSMFVLAYIILQTSRAADPSNNEVIILEIDKGQGAREIAKSLSDEGVINGTFYFNFYVWQGGHARNLQAGEYELAPSMTISQIVDIIARGEVKMRGIKITIPEGFNTKQIENVLIANGLGLQRSELEEAVGISSPLAYEIFRLNFFKDLPSRATLDGFLFPDTYIFDEDAGLNDIVGKMLLNFEEKVDEPLRVKIKASGKNLYEVVIMASLLEKEVQTFEDMRTAAGVLWKRMEIGMALQVDATLVYITGKKTGEITNDDKLIDSPFNTYRYRGLPPRPIANPGLNAIRAAAEPIESEYLYYLSAPDGETIFSKTLDEHNENRIKYLK